jgi:hypothetical protein
MLQGLCVVHGIRVPIVDRCESPLEISRLGRIKAVQLRSQNSSHSYGFQSAETGSGAIGHLHNLHTHTLLSRL